MREADGPIIGGLIFTGKLYVMTANNTYKVRIRKRWRDKNKPPLAQLVKMREARGD